MVEHGRANPDLHPQEDPYPLSDPNIFECGRHEMKSFPQPQDCLASIIPSIDVAGILRRATDVTAAAM